MAYRTTKIIKKSFVNYAEESVLELEELSKLKILTSTGFYSKQQIQIAIEKPEAIEVRIYDLSNWSQKIYLNFNRRIKKLYE